MKAILGLALVSTIVVATGARAETPEVQFLASAGSVFLADPTVARLLADTAADAQRTLLLDRIVTMPAVTDGAHRSSSDVCVQLHWHGGDVIGIWAAIRGRVTSKVVGRGVVLEVVDVALELNDDHDAQGRCYEPGN